MPWVKLTMTGEYNRARGFLTGDGYPGLSAEEWAELYPFSPSDPVPPPLYPGRTEVRTWLTPDDTLVIELYWHVYKPGEGGEHRGETVLHKDAAGYWHGTVPELLGKWCVRSKLPNKYGLLLFADNEAQMALIGTGKMIYGGAA